MGFGHRVYKNYDPRATIVKEHADKMLGKLGGDDELLDIAKELEEVALTDEYFIERKLYPNVDFYTGVIYRAMGIPAQMFTVLFAIGRLPGWIAHWREMHDEGRPQDRPSAPGLHRLHGAGLQGHRHPLAGMRRPRASARRHAAKCGISRTLVGPATHFTLDRTCVTDSCSFTIIV